MATTHPLIQATFAYNQDGSTPGYVDPIGYPEGSTQTFTSGMPVKRDANGRVVVWVDGDEEILGFALDSATGTTDTYLKVRCVRKGDVLLGNIYGAVSAITQKGTLYDLTLVSSQLHVNVAGTTDTIVKVLHHAHEWGEKNSAIGDTYELCHFLVLDKAIQNGDSSD